MINMRLESFHLVRIDRTVESYCKLVSRRVVRGFEKVRLSITERSFHDIAEEARHRPHTLKESICAIYPGQPRPVPEDIVEMEVTKDRGVEGNVIVTAIIKRGHYYPPNQVDPSSISRYDITEVEDDTKTMRIRG